MLLVVVNDLSDLVAELTGLVADCPP